MAKLNDKKIAWIIKMKECGLSSSEIAFIQKVTSRRVNQIYLYYKKTGSRPILKPPGRPEEPLEEKEIKRIREIHYEYKVGACLIEIMLRLEGIKVSHNKIHKYLADNGLSKEEPNKKKQRSYVRYEREHSMSLWHTDWKKLTGTNKWLIAYEDDASRMIMAWEVFDSPTTEASLEVLYKAIKTYGKPKAILTDRGTQFYASAKEKKAQGECKFQTVLKELGIEHILSGVSHPQTNGKIERFYGTVEQKLKHFKSIEEFMNFYNKKRPHMSLNLDVLETPEKAFYRKLESGSNLPDTT
jgi:putative transposase